MSTNNTFDFRRFGLLFRQYLIHNNKTLVYSLVGYSGVVFLVLFLAQLGNEGNPHTIATFLPVLPAVVITFGLLHVGYSFPAFRSKEKSFGYLTLPASTLEKFLFELVTRVVLLLIILPVLYWFMFNVQGWVFELFSRQTEFSSIGLSDFRAIDISPVNERPWLQVVIIGGALLTFVLPFTGAAMFNKQPLVKTIFAVALIFLFYFGTAYIVIEPLGLHNYRVDDSMWLVPEDDLQIATLFGLLMIAANVAMLLVAYLKVKEKEV